MARHRRRVDWSLAAASRPAPAALGASRQVELIHADKIRLGHTVLRYSLTPEELDPPRRPVREFTETEATILDLLYRPAYERTGAWASNNEIATELEMPHNTLRSHLRNIYAEFGLDGIADYRKRAIVVQRALLLGYGGRPMRDGH